ncbi:lysosome-associated membrane glycoprotein 2 isoform X2 [Takifugu flavidus]|uniref:lysosome-associated membrane glycoprotein 2 isoform X2 n=1 Tax=Takifugu flavidus TaxID=433684 RepID=UPI0025442B0C|nr:lysosome-associated membrane glycoprotein 2 isoform X2 [Takifugu flavidus]
MYRYFAVVLLLAFAFHQSFGTNVTIKTKDGKLCLYADLMVNFSVSYQKNDSKMATVPFPLPNNVTTNGSTCGTDNSLLMIHFGKGHSWSMNLVRNGSVYQADSIVFVYNLTDNTLFPHAKDNGTAKVTVVPKITDVGINTSYSCKSEETFVAKSVNQTLWNVLIQAFVTSGTLSENVTACVADRTTTTVAPTTPSTTTSTTPVTTTPTPTLPAPTTGNYSLKVDVNSTACLLASFGLRLGVKLGKKYEEMNLDPNVTRVSGSCGVDSSQLMLMSDSVNVTLTFTNDTKKFRLHVFTATGTTGSGMPFSESNNNLTLWEASLSSSYMCNKEQNYSISDVLTIFTFNLHVQPFGVKKGLFSTAEECFLDTDLSFLVPIAVGVALSFLIILVLISYLIGRRKSRTGYQSV